MGISPFFLDHSYKLEPWDLPQIIQERTDHSPIQQAKIIVGKLQEALEHTKVAMATTQ